MKRIVALTLAAFIALALLVSCGGESGNSGNDDPILGRWKAQDGIIYEFKANGELVMEISGLTANGSYSVNGDILSVRATFMGEEDSDSGKFKIEGDKLFFYDESGKVVYTLARLSGNSGANSDPGNNGGTESGTDTIVGTWELGDGSTYEFKANGYMVVTDEYYTDIYTYVINGSKLTLKGDFGDGSGEKTLDYTIAGNTLHLAYEGEEAVLTRVAGNSGSSSAVTANGIVGTWSDGQGTIILESDGSIIVSYDGMTMTGTYTAVDGTLAMELTYQGMTATRSCNYTLNGDKLSLESDEFLTTVLDRVG